MANEYKDYVAHGVSTDTGFSIEDKEEIENNIRRFPLDTTFYDAFCDHKTWNKGARRFTWRKLKRPDIEAENTTPLIEGVAAKKDKLVVEEYECSVENYGTYIPYTKEALMYNKDDVKADIVHQFKYKALKVPEEIKAKEFAKARYQVTPVVNNGVLSITETLDKALTIFMKNKVRPIKDNHYVFICTLEILAKLKKELRGIGDVLATVQKEDLSKLGTVYEYNGFYIYPRSEDVLYIDAIAADASKSITAVPAKQKGILLGLSEDGKQSVIATRAATPEIIFNELGAGVIKDAAGNIVADDNHRVGSVALNIDALGVATQADDARMIVLFSDQTAEEAVATTGNDVATDIKTGTRTNPLN